MSSPGTKNHCHGISIMYLQVRGRGSERRQFGHIKCKRPARNSISIKSTYCGKVQKGDTELSVIYPLCHDLFVGFAKG